MSWETLTLTTDADLGRLEPEATADEAPWGQRSWPDQIAEAREDLKAWIEADYPAIIGAPDRVRDLLAPRTVYGYTGGTYTDYTVEANDADEDDLPLADIFATPSTDRIYVGATWTFEGLSTGLLTTRNATASVLTVTYWGPSGWTDLSATDGTVATTGQTFSGAGRITWTVPATWERRTLSDVGDAYYWVALSVSAALTAETAANVLHTIRTPVGLKRVCTYLALSHVLNGLALQAVDPDRWTTKAKDYVDKATTLYTRLRATDGGIPMDLDVTGAVEDRERIARRPVVLGRA